MPKKSAHASATEIRTPLAASAKRLEANTDRTTHVHKYSNPLKKRPAFPVSCEHVCPILYVQPLRGFYGEPFSCRQFISCSAPQHTSRRSGARHCLGR